jgi:hypothetical protein
MQIPHLIEKEKSPEPILNKELFIILDNLPEKVTISDIERQLDSHKLVYKKIEILSLKDSVQFILTKSSKTSSCKIFFEKRDDLVETAKKVVNE